MVSKRPAFHYQPHSSLRIIIWYKIQLGEIFHLILAGGAWSRSPAPSSAPVAGQTLAWDYVAQTQSEGCLTRCRHRSCPWLWEQDSNPIVIVSICPPVIAISKRGTVLRRKACFLSLIWKVSFPSCHHWLVEKSNWAWLRKPRFPPSLQWQIICWCISRQP